MFKLWEICGFNNKYGYFRVSCVDSAIYFTAIALYPEIQL